MNIKDITGKWFLNYSKHFKEIFLRFSDYGGDHSIEIKTHDDKTYSASIQDQMRHHDVFDHLCFYIKPPIEIESIGEIESCCFSEKNGRYYFVIGKLNQPLLFGKGKLENEIER